MFQVVVIWLLVIFKVFYLVALLLLSSCSGVLRGSCTVVR